MFFGNFTESQSRDFNKGELYNEESAEDYGYLSDSDLEDDEDEKVASFKHTSGLEVHPFDPSGTPGEQRGISCEGYQEHVEKGKVVKIADTAFVT